MVGFNAARAETAGPGVRRVLKNDGLQRRDRDAAPGLDLIECGGGRKARSLNPTKFLEMLKSNFIYGRFWIYFFDFL
jgi:hypothetical protein